MSGFYSDADIEQSELEAAGNELHAQVQTAQRLRDAGRPFDAAKRCPHSAGYGLDGSHATTVQDPDSGSSGFRCSHCGAKLDRDPWDRDARIVNVEVSMITTRGEV